MPHCSTCSCRPRGRTASLDALADEVIGTVGDGGTTVAETARELAGAHPLPADRELARRILERLVRAGRLTVVERPGRGGRPGVHGSRGTRYALPA